MEREPGENIRVRVRELGADELGTFVDIERKTAGRRGFTARDEDYYRRFKETFGSRAHFMLAEIHANELLAGLTAEHDRLADQLDSLKTRYEAHATTRLKRQIDDTARNLTALERRLDEARALTTHGSVIPAACALFVEHRRETVYLTAGALPEYRAYQAPALLVHEGMLRLCVNSTQPRRFNMYGITGVFNDPDDEGRGVLEFKQGFNGHAEELVGAFILPTSTIRYKLGDILPRLMRGGGLPAQEPQWVQYRQAIPICPMVRTVYESCCSTSLLASSRMFRAAFTSRSCRTPHCGHVHSLTSKSLVCGFR